jgi:NAD(P)-dependent dehydrogenase (short-subunit alcohol dehydrogenase family)
MARRVLVTGGSMGIGRACASRLAADGWRVVVAARGREVVEETVTSLHGDGHEALALDVGDPAAWESSSAAIGELDALVHAAAVIGPVGPIELIDPDAFLDVLRVNVLGTFLAVRACAPALRAAGGPIVAFSGGGATGPLARYDAYAASKAATTRLVENLAADGLRINAVAPGFVATRMHEATLAAGPAAAGEEYYARTQRDLAAGGTPPETAAELVAFLLSDAARGITGKLISAPWDPWREPGFQDRLRGERDLATLRRIDDQFFTTA